MTDLKMFNPEDQENAEIALVNYDHYCLTEIEYTAKAQFGSAATCLRNAADALDELQKLKNEKEMKDQVWLMLKQLESEREQRDLLNSLGAKI